MRNAVRALLFDTFGTVVDWRGGLIAQLEAWGAARGSTADWPGLVDAWHQAYPVSLNQVRTGSRGWVNLDVLQKESMERLAPQFGLEGLNGAELEQLARMWHELPAWPDSVTGLRRLRERYTIAPLSNGHVALLLHMAKAAQLPWDTVFGADIFRHYKPDPESYLGAVALLGCEPGEVMLVASHPKDLDAAANCGLRTCHVSRPLEYGPGRGLRDVLEPGRFDLLAASLEELAETMAC